MRVNKIVDISISNFCNFSCNYCISNSIQKKIPTNKDGTARVFKDLRYNDRGFIDHSLIRKYGLIVRGERGSTYNYGILNADGSIDRTGDHVIENDFIDYNSLLSFLRNKLPDWVIQIGGGEPLLNPKIDDFLVDLAQTHKIILSTNASLLHTKHKILDIGDNLIYRIGFHPTQASIESYMLKFNMLKDLGKLFLVNFVLHPMYEKDGLGRAYVDVLKDNNIPHEVTRFYGKINEVSYPLPELSKMESELLSTHARPNYVTKHDENDPGNSMLSIYPDGNIYQCPKRMSWLGDIYGRQRYSKMNIKKTPLCFANSSCQSMISQDIAMKLFM